MAEKLSEKIYSQLRREIEAGKIDGRTILSECQLATEFNVSKAPVRDALHLLCSQGYLISLPRKGYMVNIFTAEDINQIQVIRRELEKLSARLVIERAADAEIESLRTLISDGCDAKTASETSNAMFHMKLAELSGNKYLPGILSELVYKASQTQLGSSYVKPNRHEEIVKALLERNLSKAEALIESDIGFL
jgi:DNA-binding GntR family transcriptional regulator